MSQLPNNECNCVLLYDPSPYPLASGMQISSHDLKYMLMYQAFEPGTILSFKKGKEEKRVVKIGGILVLKYVEK